MTEEQWEALSKLVVSGLTIAFGLALLGIAVVIFYALAVL